MGRVILEHPDGRRIGADENDLSDPRLNPYNSTRTIVRVDANAGTRREESQPARPQDDHISLLDEGFVIVADVVDQDVLDKDGNVAIHAGGEQPRDEKLYRGEGIDKASQATDVGRAVAAKEGNPS